MLQIGRVDAGPSPVHSGARAPSGESRWRVRTALRAARLLAARCARRGRRQRAVRTGRGEETRRPVHAKRVRGSVPARHSAHIGGSDATHGLQSPGATSSQRLLVRRVPPRRATGCVVARWIAIDQAPASCVVSHRVHPPPTQSHVRPVEQRRADGADRRTARQRCANGGIHAVHPTPGGSEPLSGASVPPTATVRGGAPQMLPFRMP